MNLTNVIVIIQLFFAIVIGLYFLNLLRNQQSNKVAIDKESKKELEKLQKLREISLTEPLSEKTRPKNFKDIYGQKDGIRALKAALCGPNPQHVIIYGPPGVGKTCAARLVLEEAKKNTYSPFKHNAKFIEVDATSIRFDERSIADSLIGSVHDPIYQGAGPLGVAGIPQPKPGAVTKAHGGVLFLDEIGELHPIQLNKLLKVLEDRKVFLESAYYNSEDTNIPKHIHDIFQNGLPADFRLIGATTRSPADISSAIRSRCMEIFFRPLTTEEVTLIAINAAQKGGFQLEDNEEIGKYAANGRDAVNIIQLSGGLAIIEGRTNIIMEDIQWVINSSHYTPRLEKKITSFPQVGFVNGIAVYGPNMGILIEIEALAIPSAIGKGQLTITGMIDEEELSTDSKKMKRRSTARSSVDNVLTVLRSIYDTDIRNYDIHLNFPGGIPIDGPSAGIGILIAIFSAITGKPVNNNVAMTGEISIRGEVKAVGGVSTKIEAAIQAGVKRVIIPLENWQQIFQSYPIEVIPIAHINDVIKYVFDIGIGFDDIKTKTINFDILSANGIRSDS